MPDTVPPLRFDDFELDEGNARLTQEGRAVQLPPKAFAVLCALAGQAGKLVTKDALLDAVWGHRHVSESVLKTTISQVRAALADDAAKPRYIETASRRGYRFIGNLAAPRPRDVRTTSAPLTLDAPAATQAQRMVGRRAALARLHAGWRQALTGRRYLSWVVGEAGVGKTTLIENFVAELADTVLVTHGQCVEQFGAGEPYLPILEALGSLCRRDSKLPEMMRAIAPTWLLQLPWLCTEADRVTLHRELAGANQDRMVRELAELMGRYTQMQPVLLVTEDLHWSDHATLRLMDHFARRRDPIRLQWLASFRLAQVIAEDHPLQELRRELRLHGLCDELMLDPFSETEVAEYITGRIPGANVSEAFIQRLHEHTDGLPLFIVNVIDNLAAQSAAPESIGEPWAQSAAQAQWVVPENLAGAIERQIARLPEETQILLETASVCGVEFRPATVAEVIGRDLPWVEERCDELVRRQYWLRHVSIDELPNGLLDTRYAFRHALYRHVFYQRIGAAVRVQLHRRVARCMERNRAAGFTVTSGELAAQCEAGLLHAAALRYYAEAAQSALSHFAPQEAANITEHALALLPRCPAGNERLELELALVAHRGVACSQQFGLASQDAQLAYERAQAICDMLPPTPARAQVVSGLAWMYYIRGEYDEAQRLAERVHELSAMHDDRTLLVFACGVMGVLTAVRAEHHASLRWVEQGLAVCEELDERLRESAFVADPVVILRLAVAVPLQHLGLIDRSSAQMRSALERARQLGQPMAKAVATWSAALLEMRMTHHPQNILAYADALDELVRSAGLVQAEGPRRWLRGWAEAQLGDPQAGYQKIIEGFAFNKRLGMIAGGSEVLGYAVEALILAKQWQPAQAQLDEAVALATRLGEHILIPYMQILQARIAMGLDKADVARSCLNDALRKSREQQSVWMALRALTMLCELPDATAEDFSALQIAYERFTEGFDTALCVRAREMIAARAH
jgi:DNA-binding winged helix-turn-helix (wHTH) protein/tetratricopeptide (TPR) repeat protein